MKETSYHFDPCSLDKKESETVVTLDNWKPSEKKKIIQKSQWRQQQIAENFNQQPGIDDLKKIHMHLKKGYPDHDIMKAFGITCEMLLAIKRDCYDPVEGISLDNQSKIYKEFTRIEKRLDKAFAVFNFLSDNLFDTKDKAKRGMLKALLSGKNQNEISEMLPKKDTSDSKVQIGKKKGSKK